MFMPKHLLHNWFSRARMQQEEVGTVSDFFFSDRVHQDLSCRQKRRFRSGSE